MLDYCLIGVDSPIHSFYFSFFVKITQLESFVACDFRGLDANRKNRKNKAPAEKTRSTVVKNYHEVQRNSTFVQIKKKEKLIEMTVPKPTKSHSDANKPLLIVTGPYFKTLPPPAKH